ncbi:hypothetical protein EUGRSUZ_I01968 [Eucalyptus grandis]|uniref:Uncharacterized protein n=2 Tax=Eucalyptus grandis TaxID=71139 RepID=A0ACC3JGZ5_EUCGR|nr:hypothetical protein EUGRSUZ_I01968 [Eucalyptus grandis]
MAVKIFFSLFIIFRPDRDHPSGHHLRHFQCHLAASRSGTAKPWPQQTWPTLDLGDSLLQSSLSFRKAER